MRGHLLLLIVALLASTASGKAGHDELARPKLVRPSARPLGARRATPGHTVSTGAPFAQPAEPAESTTRLQMVIRLLVSPIVVPIVLLELILRALLVDALAPAARAASALLAAARQTVKTARVPRNPT
jgi:hypothetical protein